MGSSCSVCHKPAPNGDNNNNNASLTELLGDELLKSSSSGQQRTSTADLCAGKIIGLYFSAHWCPPCRGFTPRLAASYDAMKAANKAIEIVFISSDQDEGSFTTYFQEMPWTALDFNDRKRKEELSERFGVSGIPSLVFVDGDSGRVITKEGRAQVTANPLTWGNVNPPTLLQASTSPHKKPSTAAEPELEPDERSPAGAGAAAGAVELFGETLVTGDGSTMSTSELCRGKTVGVYFSAHWCPPCRGFTPRLATCYNEQAKQLGKPLEIVFVSSDQDQSSFDAYFQDMPWTALAFEDRDRKQTLGDRFGVSGIPNLVFIDGDTGEVLTKDGRSRVADSDFSGLW